MSNANQTEGRTMDDFTSDRDHEEMVDAEIAYQAELVAGMTREDAEIIAHDRLSASPKWPFSLTAARPDLPHLREAPERLAPLLHR